MKSFHHQRVNGNFVGVGVAVVVFLLTLTGISAQGTTTTTTTTPAPVPYQRLATDFIAQNPVPNITVIQGTFRYALACLWFASNKVETVYTLDQLDSPLTGWTTTTNWMTNKSVCTWYGITCRNQIIVEIDLSNNGLSGNFPNELAILGPGLEYMDFSNNLIASVGGQLSWMSAMVKLKHLDLYFTNVDYGSGIPPYIRNMVDLEYLDLSYCYLRGDLDGIPFVPLINLQFLSLAGNFFEGTPIPTQILQLPKLQELYFQNSAVTDDFASIVNNVNKNISVLWINDNTMDGIIPTTISSLSSITTLSASGIGLFGTIPTQMGRMTTLRGLYFHNNSLTGTIPTQMGSLTRLVSFQTEDNTLRGSMPSAVCTLRTTKALTELSTDCSGTTPEVRCTTPSCCNCCLSPCFDQVTIRPTPAPTPAPTSKKPTAAPTPGGFICFSGQNMVQILTKNNNEHDSPTTTTTNTNTTTKMIPIHQLQLGDYVLSSTTATTTAEPHYSKVYSFGHYNNSTMAEYIQLRTTTTMTPSSSFLELSKDHMVFVIQRHTSTGTAAIPASAVQIGDQLVTVHVHHVNDHTTTTTSTALVTKITTVQRKGAYAPFTESGTIVVNHILASNYVSLQSPSEYFMIDMNQNNNINIISMHWLAHAFQAPHRIMCHAAMMTKSQDYCNNETYTTDGTSYWVHAPLLISQWMLQQHFILIMILVIPILATAIVLHCMEYFIMTTTTTNTMTLLIMIMIGGATMLLLKQPAKYHSHSYRIFTTNEKRM